MIKFTQTGRESSDCTTPYSISGYKTTVQEHIQEILTTSPQDWGYFIPLSDGQSIFDVHWYEYRYGKLLEDLPKELLNKTIRKMEARGGWSRMDYYIYI